jgi:aminoglycoside phosphotransferase (APT) family kinase protein
MSGGNIDRVNGNSPKSSHGPVQDKGPFPLCHGDFGHNNMVFDDEYNLLGVIDWEAAYVCRLSASLGSPLSS